MINKTALLVFVVSTVLIFLSLGVCYGGVETICAPNRNENTAMFIILFSASIALSNVLLLFSSSSMFRSWLRFAKYYLPIAAALILLSPVSDSSILGFDKEFMSWLLSGTFFIVSLILIIYKWFRQRGTQTTI